MSAKRTARTPKKTPRPPTKKQTVRRSEATATIDVPFVLEWLEKKSTARDRANLQRFGITATNALGVSMANLKVLAKRIGRNHRLAAGLWATGCYEARMLATLVDDPAQVTAAQMERWCRDFDNWSICDTACFHLFNQTPHAFHKVAKWWNHPKEMVRRAAFALLACVALRGVPVPDAIYAEGLVLAERAAVDPRNFVKKAVSWALRAIGRRDPELHREAIAVARRLAASIDATARWVGKDALRELQKTGVRKTPATRGR
jgi:3-methyladenine DNA glycosylase AlkD